MLHPLHPSSPVPVVLLAGAWMIESGPGCGSQLNWQLAGVALCHAWLFLSWPWCPVLALQLQQQQQQQEEGKEGHASTPALAHILGPGVPAETRDT